MLEDLRRHSTSWISKVLFGMIAAIFALYFGFSFHSRPPGGPAAPVAKVNGEAITYGSFTQQVDKQTKMIEGLNAAGINHEMMQVIESQVMQSLIAKTLLTEEARKLGLRVSNTELSSEIQKNPSFQKDGVFDSDLYLNQWLPYFESKNGMNFEEALRGDLMVDKLRNALEKGSVVSLKQVQTQAKLKATQLNVRKLTLAMKDKSGKDLRDSAMQQAKAWIATGKVPESQPHDELPISVLEETGLKNLAELQFALGRNDSLPVLQCLLELEPGKKCENPFQVGDTLVAVELIEKKSEAPVVKPDDPVLKQLAQARQNQVLDAVQNMLTQHAKIETYLSKK